MTPTTFGLIIICGLFFIMMIVQILLACGDLYADKFETRKEFFIELIPFIWLYYLAKKVRSIEEETLNKIHGKE